MWRLYTIRPIEPIRKWLIDARGESQEAEQLIEQLSTRIAAEGIPIWRVRLTVLAKHPELFGRTIEWQRGAPVRIVPVRMDIFETNAYQHSPVEAIHGGAERIHCRLDVPVEQLAYPQLDDLKAAGGTDYLILPLVFGDGRRSYISFASDSPRGFTDEHVAALEGILPLVALRLELESALFATRTLLHVYLGKNAAERVVAGAFRRGTGQVIRAAIWLCDLRGFTELVGRTPLQEVVPILDRYFEAVARPVTARGGEILKFIGDAMLAVFPVTDDPAGPSRQALEAAREALNDFANDEVAKRHGLRIGVGLHLGEVVYGNIGASDRLDFTVIGPAVNEVSRMEGLCKSLKTPLVMSSKIAEHIPTDERHSLGTHELRGVAAPQSLFTLREFAPAP